VVVVGVDLLGADVGLLEVVRGVAGLAHEGVLHVGEGLAGEGLGADGAGEAVRVVLGALEGEHVVLDGLGAHVADVPGSEGAAARVVQELPLHGELAIRDRDAASLALEAVAVEALSRVQTKGLRQRCHGLIALQALVSNLHFL